MEEHVAGIAEALRAQTDALREQTDALRAQRAEQRVGEEHAHTLTKAKTVLNPPFLVAMMLYLTTIGLSLQARSNKFGLLIPTTSVPGTPTDQMGLTGPRNQWRTDDASSLLLTIFSFLTVMGLHTYILLHLRIRGPPRVKMVATLAWLPTMIFWGCTTSYFIAYMSMNRYGVGVGQFDMVFTIVCSGIIFLMTLLFIARPVPHDKVIKTRNVQAPRAQP